MKILFIVNDIETENPLYTSTLMSYTAAKMGHDVYLMGVGDFTYYADGHVGGHAHKAPGGKFKSKENFFKSFISDENKKVQITSEELDVIMLRNNPSEDLEERPWAITAGLVFGGMAIKKGVIVLNHPETVADGNDKFYLEHFPKEVRPDTIITRNLEDIRHFYKENKNQIVLKPLQGSGGKDVFLLKKDETNLNQIVDAIARQGYVIAQSYLPEAKEGDIRMFMMNGKVLTHNGKYAAFRRVNKKADFRSNMHAGGEAVKVGMNDTLFKVAEILGPKLKQDGIFLVGLDVVGDKLMELNLFSPGGFNSLIELEEVNFAEPMIKAIEKKVYYKDLYGSIIPNIELAVME